MTVQEKEEVSCTALTTPDYESYFGKINSGSPPICNNSSNIGRNCDISCSSIFEEREKYIYCNNHSICLASNSKKPKCTCAAGCMGENCNISCPLGSYGYNCRKKCQPCKGHCLIYSGKCPKGSECTNNMDDGCKIGLERPILINSTLTSITIKIQINQTDNPEIDIDYEIQYKTAKEVKWEIERRKQKLKHEYVTLANLVPLSSYEVRINYTNDVTLPKFFYTDCKYTNTNKYINLETDEIKSTEIKVKWKAICNGKIQLTAEPTEKKSYCELKTVSELVNITNQSHKISKLIPNTRYVLKNEYGSVIKFKTKAVPMLKSPPTVIDTTLRTITVQFKSSDVIEPDPVKKFVFQYRMRKEQNRWSKTNETIFSKDLIVYVHEIVELSAEKEYEVQVLFYNKDDNANTDCNPTVTAKTTSTDLHKHKLINNLNVATSQYEATVKWKAVCNNNFEIIIQCNNEWCQKINITENLNSIAEFYNTKNLTPYTKYTLYFKTIEKEEVKLEEFRTKPAAAPKVNNLQIYSIAKDSISLRFQKPYPPYGALEYYLGQIGQCGTYNYNEKQIINAKPCELWSNYDCIQIKNNNDTSCYEILIAAKNKDVSDDEINFEIANIETKRESDKPYNLKVNNTDICFKHPNFIRGKLKYFIITIKLNNTVLIKQNFQTITELYEVITVKKSYCHKFSGYLRSSTIKISVRTKNEDNELGLPVEDFFTTEPISPLSNNDIMPIYRTNYTQKIRIPQITADTKTKNSFIFVVVCDPSSTLKEPPEAFANEKRIPKDLQYWSNCTGKQKYWVDAILNDTITEYTIGDKNEKLRPDVKYIISVIIVNEYKNNYSYKTYSITTTASEYSTVNPAIYSLFLLFLILPVIAYFIHRTINKPKNVQKRPQAMVKIFTEVEELLYTSLININLASSEEHSKLVKVKDLSQYVKESIENKYLAGQHAMFPKGATHECNYGMCKENKYKNRYNGITTYDHSRVVLKKLPNEPFSDFINASYVDGYKKPKAYIATQGPKHNTVDDFWRMIWQEEVTCIVMLANLIENRKPKCHQYWPESDCTVEYMDIFVRVTFIEVSADYVYRFLEATYKGQTRKIQHLHFISWPDHGVPLYPQSLVPFLRKILEVPTTKPIVVHCSTGVGRTGTIILVDICVRMAAKENQVDVLKYMQRIREQRANLVDNYDQYKLVHILLLECLLAPETNLPCSNLEKAVKQLINQGGLQKHMDYLNETAWHNEVMQNPLIIDEENMFKNRFTDIIPTLKQIYISRYPQNDDFSDYINAIPVDAFGIKDHFIVTQNPLPHTVKDFWRMVSEKDVRVIVSLNRILINNRTNCNFWPPNKNEQYNPIPFITLTCQSIKESSAYEIYHLSLQNSKDGNEFNIRLIQCKNWEQGKLLPASTEVFLGLLEEAHSSSRPGSSVVVTCYDGATASGLFVAMSFVIEKMKLEQVCDVCQAVRAVRSNRTQFVSHIQQFEFLYQAAVDYLKTFDD